MESLVMSFEKPMAISNNPIVPDAFGSIVCCGKGDSWGLAFCCAH